MRSRDGAVVPAFRFSFAGVERVEVLSYLKGVDGEPPIGNPKNTAEIH